MTTEQIINAIAELGLENIAMREAIKRAVAVLTNPSVEDLFNLRAYLESVLQGEAVRDFTCPKCGTGLNYVTGPVEPRAAEARTDHQAAGESAGEKSSSTDGSQAGEKPAPREQHGEREQKIKFEDDGSVTVTTKFEELAKWDADLRAAPSLTQLPEQMPEWFIDLLESEIRDDGYEPQAIWTALHAKVRERSGK